MAMNLIRTGHDVSVWNRTIEKTKPLAEMGAKVYETKRQIVENCDIIFATNGIKQYRTLILGITTSMRSYIFKHRKLSRVERAFRIHKRRATSFLARTEF